MTALDEGWAVTISVLAIVLSLVSLLMAMLTARQSKHIAELVLQNDRINYHPFEGSPDGPPKS
jgi:hypothetical protein